MYEVLGELSISEQKQSEHSIFQLGQQGFENLRMDFLGRHDIFRKRRVSPLQSLEEGPLGVFGKINFGLPA